MNRRNMVASIVAAVGGIAIGSGRALATVEEVSHTSEAIHQEPFFKASRKRVYEALTDAKQFDHVVQLGAAMKSGAIPPNRLSEISPEQGGTFSIFGGMIVGRQIELVPNQRIVQAWREEVWSPGTFSIVKFELVETAGGTTIVFDHRGFPDGSWEHLAPGWHGNYWLPLAKYLG